ncbi:capsular biosynthesis protein CpsI [Brasilonema octagenarum UFV-E1]|uniref:Capsular biosynthesis protein CpsI n=1 Tax=Brasilonema sennae CENA114 TaxID=415709 RepID=A0A856MNZ3_9CYAN|nr:NAD-dependent epimerase [Brasilonema sennae]QDL12242.1 capsular biosynthesis protein CpsI [Brasilonema sennae CENA114]QDL18621.1 capsular biosynthesis protein CpsI [Brasilonema octagenarum UFV-E1]
MRVLVTGVAGFIGYHLAQRLVKEGVEVIGIDNLNDYYDVNLKKARLAQLDSQPGFTFEFLELSDRLEVAKLFQNYTFDYVVNLAAQAGVRYSLQNPWVYIDSNVTGFVNLLEGCRQSQIKHLVFASSSSVYGINTKVPFAVNDNVDHPISLYAATKKANELIAHTYSHLYHIPTTGLRFFTVYGPWGRPDMAYFKFVKAIQQGKPIDVYNFGKMQRDFTYIDDVVEGVFRVMLKPPQPKIANVANSHAPYRLYNIGNNNPVELMTFIEVIEKALGKKAVKNLLPMQPGDVPATYADVDDLMRDVGFKPSTPLEQGINCFVQWYQEYKQAE